MAFDLSTAKPVTASKFDMSTARPVGQEEQPEYSAKQGAMAAARVPATIIAEGLKGVASLPAMATDLLLAPAYKAAGREYTPAMQTLSGIIERGKEATGLYETGQTPVERYVGAASRGIGSAASGIGLGGVLAQSARPGVAAVGELLRAQPVAQFAGGASSGIGGEAARDAGLGERGQMAASILAGLVGGVAASRAPQQTIAKVMPGEAIPAPPTASQIAQRPTVAKSDMYSNAERTSEYKRAVRDMDKAKIPLTAGQRSGTNWIRTSETTLSEVPFSGKPLQGVFDEQRKAYQRQLFKMAGLDDGTDMVTRENLDRLGDALSEKYAKALAGKTVSIADDDFMNGLASIEARNTQFVDDQSASKVRQIVNGFMEHATKNGGDVTGEWYQAQRSIFAKRAKGSGELAPLYGELKTLLDDAFKRSAGDVKGRLDAQYMRYKQLQDIYQRTGGPNQSEGFISPVQVARVASKGGGKEWERFTRSAAAVLPDRLGNSGTAQRNFILGLTGGTVPAAMIEPTSALAVLAGLAAGRGASSALASPQRLTNPILNAAPVVAPVVIQSQQ